MPAYRTIVVGTDGSATSFAAVERAAGVAADSDAQLVIVSAYTPAEEALREASDRANTAGANKVSTHAEDGAPVDVLRKAVKDHAADLLVVGNKGLNTLSGRLLGSVPSDATRRAGVDVLVVHTS